MRSIFRNKAFVVVAMMIALTITSISWVAFSRASAMCSENGAACTLSTKPAPAKGKMIWDEIAHGLISSISI